MSYKHAVHSHEIGLLPTNEASGLTESSRETNEKGKQKVNLNNFANGDAMPSLLDKNDGPNSELLSNMRTVITDTRISNSNTSNTTKLPMSELEPVVFARLDINWNETDYISQVITAQTTQLCAYETARQTADVESAATKSAFGNTLLLAKLVSHTGVLRKQLDDLALKPLASTLALPSSEDILGSVMATYPGCQIVTLQNVYRLPADIVEKHTAMYDDLQIALVSTITTSARKIAEMEHQQAYKQLTADIPVETKNIQKSDTVQLATQVSENDPQHDLFGDLPGLTSSEAGKLATPSVRMTFQATTSTDTTDVTEFGDNYQSSLQSPIPATVAYRSLLDADDQSCSALMSTIPALEPLQKVLAAAQEPKPVLQPTSSALWPEDGVEDMNRFMALKAKTERAGQVSYETPALLSEAEEMRWGAALKSAEGQLIDI